LPHNADAALHDGAVGPGLWPGAAAMIGVHFQLVLMSANCDHPECLPKRSI
jgi:hypothetical protein